MSGDLARVLADLLRRGRLEAVVGLGDLRKVSSTLIRFLYGEELMVFRAGEALGLAAGALESRGDFEYVREVVRRLFWQLNDESGGYCRGAPLAICEVGRSAPRAFTVFRNPTVSLLDNPEVELSYVAYGIGRAAETLREAYPNPASRLAQLLNHPDARVRGCAAWALGELGARWLAGELEGLSRDGGELLFYEGRGLRVVSVGELARRALRRLGVG